MLRRIVPVLGLLALLAHAAGAAPADYRLDTARSEVRFTYNLDGSIMTGRMPIHAVELTLDLENLPASRVRVTLDAAGTRAGFFMATDAIRGPRMLDTQNHPFIRFRSTGLSGNLQNLTIRGALTVRGITRTVTLDGGLYRQQGTAPTDRDRLIILLTGEISRSAFGVTGYAGLVSDRIGLRVVARIAR